MYQIPNGQGQQHNKNILDHQVTRTKREPTCILYFCIAGLLYYQKYKAIPELLYILHFCIMKILDSKQTTKQYIRKILGSHYHTIAYNMLPTGTPCHARTSPESPVFAPVADFGRLAHHTTSAVARHSQCKATGVRTVTLTARALASTIADRLPDGPVVRGAQSRQGVMSRRLLVPYIRAQ